MAQTSVTQDTTATQELPVQTKLSTSVLWVTIALKERFSLLNALTVNSQRKELDLNLDAHSVMQDTTASVK